MLLGPVRTGILDQRVPSDCSFRIAHYGVGFVRVPKSLSGTGPGTVHSKREMECLRLRPNRTRRYEQATWAGVPGSMSPTTLCQCPSFTHTYGHLCRNLIQPDEEAKKLGLRGDLAWYANAS